MLSKAIHTNNDTLPGSTQELSLDEYVYAHQVKLLFKRLPFSLCFTSIIAPLFIYTYWHENNRLLVIWFTLISLITIAQFLLGTAFTNLNLKNIHTKKWEYLFISENAVAAILWGTTSYWLTADASVATIAFHLLILASMTGGYISLFSARPLAYIIFLLGFTLPYTLNLYQPGNQFYYSTNIVFITYIIAMTLISLHVNKNIRSTLTSNYNQNPLINALLSIQNHDRSTLAAHYADIKKKSRIFRIDENSAMTIITADAFGALSSEILKHHELEKELSEKRVYLESILTSASDTIITCDKDGIILSANQAIERDFGYTEKELIGKSINSLMEEKTGRYHDRLIENHINSNRTKMVNRMLEITCRKKDGSTTPMEIRISEVETNNRIIFIGILRNISERKENEKKLNATLKELQQAKHDLQEANTKLIHSNETLKEISQHDSLTGLYNRRYLERTLELEWLRHRRSGKEISIILFDIDHFKLYNDHYGHIKGDECLTQIANIIQDNIARPGDFVARYGGEEFIVVLPNTDVKGAYNLATKICKAIYDLNIEHIDSNINNRVTISAGIADAKPELCSSFTGLVELADQALYQAKESGRNKVIKVNNA